MQRSILLVFLFGTILGGENIDNQQQTNADNLLNRINGTTITAGFFGALTEMIRHNGAWLMMRNACYPPEDSVSYVHNKDNLRHEEGVMTCMAGAISKPLTLNAGHTITEYVMNPSSLQQKEDIRRAFYIGNIGASWAWLIGALALGHDSSGTSIRYRNRNFNIAGQMGALFSAHLIFEDGKTHFNLNGQRFNV